MILLLYSCLSYININLGDHYSPESKSWIFDIILQILGAGIGFAGALYLFGRGLIADRIKVRKSHYDLRRNHFRYYLILIEEILEPIKYQIKYLNEYVERQKRNPFELEVMAFELTGAYDRFNRAGNKEVLESFEFYLGKQDSDWLSKYNLINQSASYLAASHWQIQQDFRRGFERAYEKISSIKILLDNLTVHAKDYMLFYFQNLEKDNNKMHYNFFNSLLQDISAAVEKGEAVDRINETVLTKYLKELSESSVSGPHIYIIRSLIIAIQDKLTDLRMMVETKLDGFIAHAGQCKIPLERLTSILQDLKKVDLSREEIL